MSHNKQALKKGDKCNEKIIYFTVPGAGVREITGRLDLSNNLITDFTSLMMDELGTLYCVAELNIEFNDVEKIGYVVIEQSLKTKWDECGSSL